MIFNIEFWNEERYLPTKRHRKLRTRYVKNSVDVKIKEPSEKEFPIAFIVKDYGFRYDEEGSDSVWGEIKTEIRVFDNKLWKAERFSERVSHGCGWTPLSYMEHILRIFDRNYTNNNDFTEDSIIKESNILECKNAILNKSTHYLIFDNKIWKECGEPMYMINTFGLGHNHGGTGFFIEYYYNSNIPNTNYFNALEREKAIAYGKSVAARRGDTESIEGMGDHDIIEILMPEMVKRNPKCEHGDGDPFLNSIEDIISGTESSTEAGLLTIAMTSSQLSA